MPWTVPIVSDSAGQVSGQKGNGMKTKLLLAANLLLISVLFLLGNFMTTVPGRSSGNGNPAILILIPLSFLFCILVMQWFHYLKGRNLRAKSVVVLLLIMSVHLLGGLYYKSIRYQQYRNYLAHVYEEKHGSVDCRISIPLLAVFLFISTWMSISLPNVMKKEWREWPQSLNLC